jgi:hypothetical protein
LYAETGRSPLHLKAFNLCANYFVRISDLNFPRDRLLYKSFNDNRSLKDKSWLFHLLSLAKQGLGFAHQISKHRVEATGRESLALVATSLAQHVQSEAKSKAQSLRLLRESTINSPRKLYYYSQVWLAEKCPLTYPSFLFKPFSKCSRILLSFRASSHQLAIETGAYSSKKDKKEKIPKDSRFCLLCQNAGIQEVETENHFVRFCSALNDIRNLPKFSSIPFDKDVTTIVSSQFFPLNAQLLSELSDKRSNLLSSLHVD